MKKKTNKKPSKKKNMNKPKKTRTVKLGKKNIKKSQRKKSVKPKNKKKMYFEKIERIIKFGKNTKIPLDFENIRPDRERIVVLVVSIIFLATGMFFSSVISSMKPEKTANIKENKNIALEAKIRETVRGYPIEKMTPYIAEKNPKTAAFLVAIAKKESNWGKSKPVLNGKDCYNYWGFRLQTDIMGSDGHTCFRSPKQAVDIVAKRIDEMIKEENADSSRDMIVWKCGSSCEATGGQVAAEKWISDVGFYYNKFSDYL